MQNYITVGGRDYPVAFTMSALMNFTTKYKITLGGLFKLIGYDGNLKGDTDEEIGTNMLLNSSLTLEQIVEITKFALKAGANAENKPKDYTTQQVAALFDEKPGLAFEVLPLLILSISKVFTPQGEEQADGDDQKKASPAKAKAAKN